MDHKTAMNTFATERYTLDAMTAAERDAFEEHFVDCRICSVDVREAAEDMAEDGQVVPLVVPPVTPEPEPFLQRWRRDYLLPMAATLIIGLGIGRTMAPTSIAVDFDRPTPSLTLFGALRGAAEENVIRANTVAQLYVGIPTAENAAAYRAEVRRDGRMIQSWSITPEEAEEPVPLPLRPLPPGGYELVIESVDRGGKRSKVTSYPFNAESEDRQQRN